MQTEPPASENSRVEPLRQMASAIEALNARIARLAIGLGVSLDSNDDVVSAMTWLAPSSVAQERRVAPERREVVRMDRGSGRRVAHQREELRGLLVLRYGVETRYVEQVGVIATQQILIEVEAHLVRDGFKPGADGINLDRLFNEP